MENPLPSLIRVLDVDSLHIMKRYFYHENTKVGKHDNFISFFRAFVISCFRD
jgi:hypothetical protein